MNIGMQVSKGVYAYRLSECECECLSASWICSSECV